MISLPYLTPAILQDAETGVISLVIQAAPEYAWLKDVTTSQLNGWVLQGICNEINSLTGAKMAGA